MHIGSLPPISNRATWREAFEVFDDETNSLIDLTDALITFEFARPHDCLPSISADVQIIGIGRFEAHLSVDQTRALEPGQYRAGCVITRGNEAIQQFIGTVAVLDGEVR